jgi:hypothetical protein
MPPEVAEHVVPAAWVVAAAGGGFVGLCGVLWAYIVWLRARIAEGVEEAIHGDRFEARVTKIVGAAFAGYADPVTRAVSDIELRQRDHGRRLGALEQDMAGLKGRLHTTRISDTT